VKSTDNNLLWQCRAYKSLIQPQLKKDFYNAYGNENTDDVGKDAHRD
jgi:hypothetical protein